MKRRMFLAGAAATLVCGRAWADEEALIQWVAMLEGCL